MFVIDGCHRLGTDFDHGIRVSAAPCRPAHAVCRVLLGGSVCRMLIGAMAIRWHARFTASGAAQVLRRNIPTGEIQDHQGLRGDGGWLEEAQADRQRYGRRAAGDF